jgi:pimeloyl-ACP methyl ester carboxylesterase
MVARRSRGLPVILGAVFAAIACILAGSAIQPGPQVATFSSDVDGSDQPYALYVPRNFDPAKRYPLVVSLHGAWSNHRLNLRRVFGMGNRPGESDLDATRYFPPLLDVDYLVASPLARGTLGYQGIPEKDVYDVLADVKRRFPVDEDRVYLTGLSMGGGGAVWLGLTHPDIWAAIAAVCPAVPPGAVEFAPNALNVPIQAYQGAVDPLVNPAGTRELVSTLRQLDTKVEYIEYPNVQHNSWDKAYAKAQIFDWFARFKRNRYPDRVRFVTDRYEYPGAYWVRIDRLTPGTPASIDVSFTARNRISVQAHGLDAFTLAVGGHPRFAAASPLIVKINGAAQTVTARASASFMMTAGHWSPGHYQLNTREKRPGLEGPIGAALSQKQIYVYGIGAAATDVEAETRKDIAGKAAEWSTPRMKLLLTFPVKSDKDVRLDAAEHRTLVLFGTSETNDLIARVSGKLPLRLNPGAADYGLIFVAPVYGNYVVVNSGLPWWTNSESVKRGQLAFLPPVSIINTFPDYVLFKGGLDNIVAEGRFDRDWRVPAADAARIMATGAAEVRSR